MNDKEFQNIIPPLTSEEFNQLEMNILKEGIREPIITWNNFIIDGHNRYKIAVKHGLSYTTIAKEFDSRDAVVEWMILNQFGKRNLSTYQRSLLALNLKPMFQEKIKSKSKRSKTNIKKQIAKIVGVSQNTITKVEKIQKNASNEIKDQLFVGKVSVSQAYNELRKEERRNDILQQKKDIDEGKVILPQGKFEVIVIDPPWNYGTRFDSQARKVANPYPEMNQEELKKLKIPACDDSVIFLWTTHRFIFDAKELLEHWGFKYKNIIVWDKEKIGIGDLFRMQCEFCLVGFKGKPVFNNNNKWRDIFTEQRREHSRKPDFFYTMIDELCVGRKLDFFSRQSREDWIVFGNELNKFQ